MSDVTQCSRFIANSIPVYDVFCFQSYLVFFHFCSFPQLVTYSHP